MQAPNLARYSALTAALWPRQTFTAILPLRNKGYKPSLSWALLALSAVGLCPAAKVHGQVVMLTPAYQFALPVAVGGPAEAGMATVRFSATGSVSAIKVLTQGIPNQDFAFAAGGSCATGNTYFTGQICTVAVSFQPTAPGNRQGAVVLQASDGSVLGSELMDGTSLGSLAVFIPAFIQGFAGNGQWIYQGDGGPAQAASLFLPMAAVPDSARNVFISDSNNQRVRRVDGGTGIISTVAGSGGLGYSGDGGPATSATLSTPSALLVDGAGNLYIADSGNNVIRVVNAATGTISTLVGTGQSGYSGDTGQATMAKLSHPNGLAFDGDHQLYISDTGNNVIRKVDLSTGIITTVAGTGVAGFAGDGSLATAGLLNYPWGISLGADGSLYVADISNNRIRKVSATGILSTAVGNGLEGFAGDGGPAKQAMLNVPAAVVVDVAGNLYIADSGNQLIRKVNATTGEINTVAGSSSPYSLGNNGGATHASLDGPYSVSLDGAGNLYIADMFHHMIREVNTLEQSLFFPVMRVGRVSDPQAVTVENDGNAPLNYTSFQPIETQLDPATTTCAIGQPVASAATCTFGLEFAPTVTGNPVTGAQIGLISNAVDPWAVVYMNGQVLSVDPTLATLTTSANPIAVGVAVTFTSSITTTGTSAPTGTVNFMDGTVMIGAATLSSSGTAAFSVSTLALGPHTITAVYNGDSQNANATSVAITENVQQATTTAIASTPNPSTAQSSVTFTATVAGPTGSTVQPSGTVTFYDGALGLGSGTLNAGIASASITSLSAGTHNITAKYAGNTNDLPSESAVLVQTVAQMPTKTSLSSSSASVYAGLSVVFTSGVSRTDGIIPTGVVTFMDGSSSIGAVTLDGTGTAAWIAQGLLAGTHSISAVYAGDANNQTSTSAILIETVQQLSTSTTLAASADPANAGAMLQFTATVSSQTSGSNKSAGTGLSSGGVFSGTVTFQDGIGGPVLGTATVSAAGIATMNISTLSVGAHNVAATYIGNTNYVGSASSPMLETIISATTSTMLASSLNPSIAGGPVVLTSTVVGTGGTATGTVTFFDGAGGASTIVGSGALNAKGIAIFTTSTLSVGQHTLTAVYGGDSKDNASTSGVLIQTVQSATSSTTVASSTNPSAFGTGVTFTASIVTNGGTATGTVTFSDGSTVFGTAPLIAGQAVFNTSTLTLGAHSITATYGGDANNSASRSQTVVQQVVQAGGVTLSSSANPSIAGTSVSFTAAIAAPQGIAVTGTVTFKDGGTVLGLATLNGAGMATFSLSTLPVGQHTIVASYSGDTNNLAAFSTTLVQTVQTAGTSVTLVSSANPSLFGSPLALTSSVVGKGGSVTGSVSFQDGTAVLGTVNLNAGMATFMVPGLSPGMHSIIAIYNGDANDLQSTSPVLSQNVVQTTNVVLTSSQNPSLALDSVTFVGKVSNGGSKPPSGTMIFKDGTTTLATLTLDATGTATFAVPALTSGQHTISAAYGGDVVDLASLSSVLMQSVQLRPTTDTLTDSSTSLTGGQQVTLISVVHFSGPVPPTGTVTFMSNGTNLGTATLDNTGVATFTVNFLTSAPTVIATYSGDTVYGGSVSTQSNITVSKPSQLTIQLSPAAITLQSQQHSTTMVTLTSLNSFADTIDLSCAGLPFAATCTFDSDRVVLGANAIQTIRVVVDTGSPLTAGSEARLEQHTGKSLAAICSLPGGLLLGFLFWRGKRRMRSSLGGLLMLLLLVALSGGLSGCGGLQINGTPAGKYVFQVTATGTGTGVMQATNMTLTVTQ